MTVATTFTAPSTTTSPTTTQRHLGRTGLVAGATAAVATTTYAAAVHGAGVSFAVSGKAIPTPGFGEVTFVAALIGTAIAAILARRATRPLRTFVITTVALTLASFAPDLTADAHVSTKVALVLSHVLAAAIVIPALASRLSD
jgi:Family of unknown function (DUF6069)